MYLVYQIEILKAWHMVLISIGSALLVWLLFIFIIVPRQKNHILKIKSDMGSAIFCVAFLTILDRQTLRVGDIGHFL